MHHLSLLVPAYPWMHHHPLLNYIYIMYHIYTHIYPWVHRCSLLIFIYLIYHWMHHRSLLIYLWMHHRSLLFQLDMSLKGGSLMHYNVWYSNELEMVFTTTYTQIELIILLKIFRADTDSEISFCIWFVDCTAYDIWYQYLAMRYLSNKWNCIYSIAVLYSFSRTIEAWITYDYLRWMRNYTQQIRAIGGILQYTYIRAWHVN